MVHGNLVENSHYRECNRRNVVEVSFSQCEDLAVVYVDPLHTWLHLAFAHMVKYLVTNPALRTQALKSDCRFWKSADLVAHV